MSRPPLVAIVWDFDNTLVDTGPRNRSVTRSIVSHLTGRDPDDFPALRDQRAYDRALHRTQNWQELYAAHFEMSGEEIREAGRLWTRFQLSDETPADWFAGIGDAVRELATWPQGIVSMNTKGNIDSALRRARLDHAFGLVVGCEEVPYHRQKPDPHGLLHCIETLVGGSGPEPRKVAFVGDHPVDAECAANANRALEEEGHGLRVVSIGAGYGTLASEDPWPIEPTHRAHTPADVPRIVREISVARDGM